MNEPWSRLSHSQGGKYLDKSPPPEWDGSQPEKDLARVLPHTEAMAEHHGRSSRETRDASVAALTGNAKLLIYEELLRWDAGQRIFDALAQAQKHIPEFEDQDDYNHAICKLHRERNQTLLQFAKVPGLPF